MRKNILPNVNGNLKNWLSILGFLGAFGLAAMAIGIWKSGVDQGTMSARQAKAAADTLAESSKKIVAAQQVLTDQVSTLNGSVSELNSSVDRLTVTVHTTVATRDWVNSLKAASEVEHRALAKRIGELEEEQEKTDRKLKDLEKRRR